jgi:hypothetical protein
MDCMRQTRGAATATSTTLKSRPTAIRKGQRRTQDLEVRRKMRFDIQWHIAAQQDYVYLYAVGVTGSWQPYVKHYAPNPTCNYGGRAAVLWLERSE